jgi:uncharacterized protein (DUF1778 family)
MAHTPQWTRLPLYLSARDRQLLESAARLDGSKLSSWVRNEALKAARRKLKQLDASHLELEQV